MNEYDKQANDFLAKYEIEFSYELLGKSFKWNMPRYHYITEFIRKDKKGNVKTMQIEFWGSNADFSNGIKALTAYDVLSCISGDHQYRTVNDVINSFGHDLTGIDVDGLLEESRKMRKFFTPKMLDDLCEIN